jgi:hypothetical protein
VNDIFEGRLVYSPDSVELFNLSMEKKKSGNHIRDLRELMDYVRNNHTYISRIKEILRFLPD